MPLKHRTETFLVVLLAIVVMITGLLIATLPPLPNGLIPWAIVFVATLAYPIILYPLFRADRADYEFRTLHWVPAMMVFVWLLLQIAAMLVTPLGILEKVYTWAWLLPVVSLAILAILLFCTKVIRQWTKRIFLILLVFVPFATLALWSSSGPHIETELANTLWGNTWGSSIIAATQPLVDRFGFGSTSSMQESSGGADSSNSVIAFDSSSDPNEQKWRDYLLDYQNGSQSASAVSSVSSIEPSFASDSSDDSSGVSSENAGGILGFFTKKSSSSSEVSEVSSSSVSSDSLLIGQTSSVPTELTNSGFGWAFIILSMVSLYCALLHRKQAYLA